MSQPKPQQIYRHFKGKYYQILTIAIHSETGEELVIYQALYGDFRVYARPLSMFMEKVDKVKYKEASQEYRFELVDPKTLSEQPEEALTRQKMTDQEETTKEQPEESVKKQPEHTKSQEETKQIGHTESQEETKQSEQIAESEWNIDPLVLEFLDADNYEKRLEILSRLHPRITDEMIDTMAVSVDIEIDDGDVEDRYTELKNCLLLYDKFETNRLR